MGSLSEPPEGCQHYTKLTEVPWDVQKYWHQRHSIFSKYDDGVWMTEDAWFGVTPEPVACKIARQVSEAVSEEKAIIIDCFAGVGGNAIAFAQSRRWKRVYAIEKDAATLACAKHNAELYGVQDRISWYLGDCFRVVEEQLADLCPHSVMFISPPWGGPGYRSDAIFDLTTMQPYSLAQLVGPFQKRSSNLALYLPRTSDLRQLVWQSKTDSKITVIHYCMEGASKAICAYIGNFEFKELIAG